MGKTMEHTKILNLEFWKAFAEAKTRFITPEKDKKNSFANDHMYWSLETLNDAARKAFHDGEQTKIHYHFEDINTEDQAGVSIWLVHLDSGETHTQLCMVDKGNGRTAQVVGGCYTYAKRYILTSLFAIGDAESDDDGNLVEEEDKKAPKKATKASIKKALDLMKKEKINSRIFKICGIENADNINTEQLIDLNAKIDATIKSRKEEF
tara:strand:+ start:2433 stop:3056 length:624 start_codon:yes stop_codon:yes gene_type:complete